MFRKPTLISWPNAGDQRPPRTKLAEARPDYPGGALDCTVRRMMVAAGPERTPAGLAGNPGRREPGPRKTGHELRWGRAGKPPRKAAAKPGDSETRRPAKPFPLCRQNPENPAADFHKPAAALGKTAAARTA